ncbi:rCG40917 [Rattus norvegicus]|uniref:RCG40917 n=1 Tax=Rattus norvegicus TaxID=10116 RepID=A6KKV5_RAT|nr:rCG40917 [Rattus norvegicus]
MLSECRNLCSQRESPKEPAITVVTLNNMAIAYLLNFLYRLPGLRYIFGHF